MKRTIRSISSNHNVGYLDALARLAIAGAGLYSVAMVSGQVSEWNSILALLSTYPLITALCRWDPIYEVSGISTRRPGFDEARFFSGHPVMASRPEARPNRDDGRKAA